MTLTMEAWERAYMRFRAAVSEDELFSWFGRMEVQRIAGMTIELSFPTRFLCRWVSERYDARLSAALDMECPGAGIRYVTRVIRAPAVMPAATLATVAIEPSSTVDVPATQKASVGAPLDPRFVFSSYRLGDANRLAQAAVANAATGRVAFNPLYLHSGIGLGKTHLVQALAAAVTGQGRRTVYLVGERFASDFEAAQRARAEGAFKEAVRGADLLVIDDLQWLQGRTAQREFGFTLNAFIDAGRQIVLTADRPPVDLGLEDRVRSRLAGGLVVEIEPFGEDLRRDILIARTATLAKHHAGFAVPSAVLEFIVRQCVDNGRDLDGAINRLLARQQLSGEAVTLEMAELALHDLVRSPEPKRVRVDDIVRVVAKHYNVTRADLLSQRRTANVVKPRQIAMYLSKTLTLRSLPEIGRRFGGRDHTTVLHAVRKIEGLCAGNTVISGEVKALTAVLAEGIAT
ncbi:chromosomal replication initiator protein DnaA [Ancylobacter sonchi]|uniref:chromosomal replication initiator protein DnaA n=1 Tax=Ancylobacter sonchi TaxID=1937790 RepID=UPI001BD5F15E|nr:chromosomal replication initiator protein DnaA [Ancylobacter sonchi]MBS7532105.1 chromosomal replication initiator protein DnaA [Ancylobacter sonchi]